MSSNDAPSAAIASSLPNFHVLTATTAPILFSMTLPQSATKAESVASSVSSNGGLSMENSDKNDITTAVKQPMAASPCVDSGSSAGLAPSRSFVTLAPSRCVQLQPCTSRALQAQESLTSSHTLRLTANLCSSPPPPPPVLSDLFRVLARSLSLLLICITWPLSSTALLVFLQQSTGEWLDDADHAGATVEEISSPYNGPTSELPTHAARNQGLDLDSARSLSPEPSEPSPLISVGALSAALRGAGFMTTTGGSQGPRAVFYPGAGGTARSHTPPMLAACGGGGWTPTAAVVSGSDGLGLVRAVSQSGKTLKGAAKIKTAWKALGALLERAKQKVLTERALERAVFVEGAEVVGLASGCSLEPRAVRAIMRLIRAKPAPEGASAEIDQRMAQVPPREEASADGSLTPRLSVAVVPLSEAAGVMQGGNSSSCTHDPFSNAQSAALWASKTWTAYSPSLLADTGPHWHLWTSRRLRAATLFLAQPHAESILQVSRVPTQSADGYDKYTLSSVQCQGACAPMADIIMQCSDSLSMPLPTGTSRVSAGELVVTPEESSFDWSELRWCEDGATLSKGTAKSFPITSLLVLPNK
jgi:hypothetical protein